MRSDVIRTYKTVHTWTGLIGGMALFICFYAGALTMFKESLTRWASPTQTQTTWVTEEQWPALIAAVLETHPEAQNSFTLNVQQTEATSAPVTWRKSREATELQHATLDANGELQVSGYQPSAMGDLVDLLHRTAGIPGESHHYIGVYVMGVICVLYMLALVSGFIILLPTLISDFFALRHGKNLKRFWLDAHNVVGITSLPFHIIIAWTVIVFAFHDQIYDGLQKHVYGETDMFAMEAVDRSSATPVTHTLDELMPPALLLARVREISPDFVPREMNYSRLDTPNASVQIMGEHTQMIRAGNRGFVYLNPFTAEVTDAKYLPGYENSWLNIVITFFSLHFGNFGGLITRWAYFLLGLGGAFLFYSGNLLWIESRRKKQRRGAEPVTQKRNTELMAAATVGVCWGCVAGVSAAMAAGKWLHGVGSDPDGWYMTVYYVVFLGCVGWSFIAGVPRAAVHLLWTCALATLAIPLTALMAAVLPDGSPWPWVHTSLDTLSVDLIALIGGVLFIVMARRMQRRIHEGVQDSVWGNASAARELPAVEGGLKESAAR